MAARTREEIIADYKNNLEQIVKGCRLDEGDTKLLLTDDLTAKGKSLVDHMMVKNHYDAFLYIKTTR